MIKLSEIRQVNREYRREERRQAHLWPVTRMSFDLAERVIDVAGYIRREGEDCYDAIQYRDLLDHLASQIVNDSAYWRIGLRSTLRLMYGE